MTKYLSFGLTVLMMLATSPLAYGNQTTLPTPNGDQPINRIAAIVNKKIITERKLEDTIAQIKQTLTHEGSPLPDDNTLRQRVLNRMIDRDIQLAVAKQRKITTTDQEVNHAIANIAKEHKITPEQLKNAVVGEGLNFKDYKAEIRSQMVIARLQRKMVARNINISDKDIAAYLKKHPTLAGYTEYQLNDIIINLPENATASQLTAAEQKANNIAAQLKTGISPTTLTSHSVDVNTLNWSRLNALPDMFAKAVANLPQGSVVGPLKAENGFHVLKLSGVRVQSTKMTKQMAQKQLFMQTFHTHLEAWLKDLRDTAYIKIMS